MNLKISGHHVELTPALREYVQNKLERIKRHFDNVIDITVTLAVDANTEKDKRQRAEIQLAYREHEGHGACDGAGHHSRELRLARLWIVRDFDS